MRYAEVREWLKLADRVRGRGPHDPVVLAREDALGILLRGDFGQRSPREGRRILGKVGLAAHGQPDVGRVAPHGSARSTEQLVRRLVALEVSIPLPDVRLRGGHAHQLWPATADEDRDRAAGPRLAVRVPDPVVDALVRGR